MACGPGGCGGDPRMPHSPPVNLNSNSGNSSYRIQNGRLMPTRSQRYQRRFSPLLHRISRLLQHPMQISFRELCILILVVYGLLYRGYIAASDIGTLLFEQSVSALDFVCFQRSVGGCMLEVWWILLQVLGRWAGEVVPWGIVAVVVVFLAEEVVLRRRG
ncbi:hypothetical protein BD289DRAFT_443457 [Coniella lustricola]|uniref:Uncharacterized protein n=1 Tax=Coniella lustricola TaxID=2025994 RepID=A0A2T2ZX40_9PEZI|nr:hypothetical protein BD289DRAFT_443457 [Coniella lustricola]